MADVSYSQADQITASQLAVDCQIEHGQITHSMGILEMNTDCPNVF